MIQRSKRLADKLVNTNKIYKVIFGIINTIINVGVLIFLGYTLMYLTSINTYLKDLHWITFGFYTAGCLGIIIRSTRKNWGVNFRWKEQPST